MLETLFRHLDMVRLSAAGVLMLSLVGCTGLIDGGSDGLTSQQREAKAKWDKAYPVLEANCAGCHAGSRAMVDFIAGADSEAVRTKLLAYDPPVVNLEAASSSRVLTKNVHEGPPLNSDQMATVLAWVQAEATSAAHDPDHPIQELTTPAKALALCTGGAIDSATCMTNHIALSDIPTAGASVPGAEIAFTAQALTDILYLSNLKVSGGTGGAYLEHLLFVSTPMGKNPIPDQIDRYFALKLNVKPGETLQIDGGTAVLAGFSGTDMLELHFKTLTAFKPDTTGGTGQTGCKVFASFKTNAVAQLNANCASCHAGGNVGATGAMDITGINTTDDTKLLAACNQVRTRINLTNTDQSSFYLAPDPASGVQHQLKLSAANFTTFKTSLDVWAKAEKQAP